MDLSPPDLRHEGTMPGDDAREISSSCPSPGFWTTIACLAVIAGAGVSPGLASPVPSAVSTQDGTMDGRGLAVFAGMQDAARDIAFGGEGPSAIQSDARAGVDPVLVHLAARQDTAQETKASLSSDSSTTVSAATTSSSSNSSSTTTNSNLPPAPTAPLAFPTSAASTDLSSPQPFDTTLSYNLSDGCVTFFAGFLQDARMTGGFNAGTGCLSFGLLQSASSQWKKMYVVG